MGEYFPTAQEVDKAYGALYRAAKLVLKRWSRGRLDEAVRSLQRAVDSIDSLR